MVIEDYRSDRGWRRPHMRGGDEVLLYQLLTRWTVYVNTLKYRLS